jgi:hypothetical protein
VADDHDGLAVEARPAADDRRVVAVGAVAVELDEVGEGEAEIVERERPARRARDLDALQGREVLVDVAAELGELGLQRLDLRRDVELLLLGRLRSSSICFSSSASGFSNSRADVPTINLL